MRVFIFFTMFLFIMSVMIHSEIMINEIMYNPSGDDETEFVELYNSGGTEVNLDGYRLTKAVEFVFPAGTGLLPDHYMLITKDTSKFRGYYGFSADFEWSGTLNNTGESILLRNASLVQIDSVYYRSGSGWPTTANGKGPSLELKSPDLDNSIGNNWGASLDSGGTPGSLNSLNRPVPQPVFSPAGLDFGVVSIAQTLRLTVTVKNEGGSEYTITGLALSLNDIFSVDLVPPISLAPQQSLNFTVGFVPVLAREYRDTLRITDNTGTHSIPLIGTGKKSYPLYHLVINEIMYNPLGNDSLEFIEIMNPEGLSVDLQDYRISSAVEYTFPTGSGIGAGDYWVLARDTVGFSGRYSFPADGEWHTGSLNNTGESIVIKNPDGVVIDSVLYSSKAPWPIEANGKGPSLELTDWALDNNDGLNWSASLTSGGSPGSLNTHLVPLALPIFTPPTLDFGKVYTGDTLIRVITIENRGSADLSIHHIQFNYQIAFLHEPLTQLTIASQSKYELPIRFVPILDIDYHDILFVETNVGDYQLMVSGSGKIQKQVPRLVINEIMYNPLGDDVGEFVELYNADSLAVTLTGYRFSRGIDHTFTDSIMIVPGEYRVMVKDTAQFHQIYPLIPCHPWKEGVLNNSGESIVFQDRDANLVDSVSYRNTLSWPSSANGNGPSLELKSPDLDNTLGENWSGSRNLGGSPGQMNSILWKSPAIPILTVPNNYGRSVITNPVLCWHQADFAQFYQCRLGMDSLFSDPYLNQSGLSDTILAVSELEYHQTYYWQVRSYNLVDSSQWSPFYQFTTQKIDETPPRIIYLDPAANAVNIPVTAPVRIRLTDDISGIDTQTIRFMVQQTQVIPVLTRTLLDMELVYQPLQPWPYQTGIYINLKVADREDNWIEPLEYYFVTKADTEPPRFIENPVIHHLNPVTVLCQWKNDEVCKGYLQLENRMLMDTIFDTIHHFILDSLQEGTNYQLSAYVIDPAGNTSSIITDTFITGQYSDSINPSLIDEPCMIYCLPNQVCLGFRFSEAVELLLRYSTDSTEYQHEWSDEHYGIDKKVELGGLQASTRYFYQIILTDKNRNVSVLKSRNFYTAALDDAELAFMILPRVSQMDAQHAWIEFEANRPVWAELDVVPAGQVGSSGGSDPVQRYSSQPTIHHVFSLDGLVSNQTYHYQAKVYLSLEGESIMSPQQSFTYTNQINPDDQAVIRVTNLSVYRAYRSIYWILDTDQLSRPEILYWRINQTDTLRQIAPEWAVHHSLALSPLEENTGYGYRLNFPNEAGKYYRIQKGTYSEMPVILDSIPQFSKALAGAGPNHLSMFSASQDSSGQRPFFSGFSAFNQSLFNSGFPESKLLMNQYGRINQSGLSGEFTTLKYPSTTIPGFIMYPVIEWMDGGGVGLSWVADQPVMYRLYLLDPTNQLLRVTECGQYEYYHQCYLTSLIPATYYKMVVDINNPQGLVKTSDTLSFWMCKQTYIDTSFIHPLEAYRIDSSRIWIHAHTVKPSAFELSVQPIEMMGSARWLLSTIPVPLANPNALSVEYTQVPSATEPVWNKTNFYWHDQFNLILEPIRLDREYQAELKVYSRDKDYSTMTQSLHVKPKTLPVLPLSLTSTEPERIYGEAHQVILQWNTDRPSWYITRYWIPGTSDTMAVTSHQLDIRHRVYLTGLIPGVSYQYDLCIFSFDDPMDYRIKKGILPADRPEDTIPPEQPQALVGEYLPEQHLIRLQWNKNSDPDLGAYRIHRSTDRALNDLICSFYNDTVFMDDRIDPDHTYIYQVTALDIHDPPLQSLRSEPCCLNTVTTGLSTGNTQTDFQVSFYPNPFSDRIYFRISSAHDQRHDNIPITITLYDLNGRKIFLQTGTLPTGQNGVLIWDGRNDGNQEVASGLYLMLISSGNQKKVGKILRIK